MRALVILVEARDRACALAVVRTRPAFFAVARDRDRFVALVGVPRVFFVGPRLFFAAPRGDFETERFRPLELSVRDALLDRRSDRDREETGELRPSGRVPFEPSSRTSRSSSRPATIAPIIMVRRSSCLNAPRIFAAA